MLPLCYCGAGDFTYESAPVEGSDSGERLGEMRIRQAVDIGAEIMVTACPFCLSTLEDAVLTSGNEGVIQVLDIAEIVSQVI